MIICFQKFLFKKQLPFSAQQGKLFNCKENRISDYKRLFFFSLFVLILVFILSSLINFNSKEFVQASIIGERQVLERQLKEVEKEIVQLGEDIEKTRQKRETLNRQLSILRNQIRRLELQSQESRLMMRDLELQIIDTEDSIKTTSLKIEQRHQNLSDLLRLIYKEGRKTALEIFLVEKRLSAFFDNLIALDILSSRTQISLEEVRGLKDRLENQKQILGQERGDLQRILKIQILQKEEAAGTQQYRERLLRETKGREDLFQKQLKDAQKRAAEIRARIFELVDIPDAPTFGEALELAQWVEQRTGIRPSFLLAIITQESALGRNVGRCHLVNFETGESVHIRTGKRMQRGMAPGPPHHRERNDVFHFLNITRALGRDPKETLISCPMAFGWGGAIGPAQFIPTTWINRKPALQEFIVESPDPWNIRHAFLASALYLRDLGGRANEQRAALRYFAGGNWANPKFRFYGNQVVRRINCLQTFIDYGTMTAECEGLIFIPR